MLHTVCIMLCIFQKYGTIRSYLTLNANLSSNTTARRSVSQFLLLGSHSKFTIGHRYCTHIKLSLWMKPLIQSLASSNNRYSNPLAILNRLWSDKTPYFFIKNKSHVVTFAVVGGTIINWYLIGRIGFSQILQINAIVWIIKLGRKLFLS